LALAEIFADSGEKGRGLCIFSRKNSFQGLEAINLGADLQILDIAFCG